MSKHWGEDARLHWEHGGKGKKWGENGGLDWYLYFEMEEKEILEIFLVTGRCGCSVVTGIDKDLSIVVWSAD